MLAHCDLTVYLTVRDSCECTVNTVLAHTFTEYICNFSFSNKTESFLRYFTGFAVPNEAVDTYM